MTKRLKIGLSRDHVGKRLSPKDRGAAVDVDSDGVVEPHEHEAHYTGIYGLLLEAWLVAYGHEVVMFADDGDAKPGWPSYKARQLRADALGVDLYLALHLNALTGRIEGHAGDYGSFFFHHQTVDRPTPNGGHYAVSMRDALREACPELRRVFARSASPASWRRAYSTIRYSQAITLCLEPFFIDQEDHQPLLRDLDRVAHAIAYGIHLTVNPGAKPLRPLGASIA